MEGLGSGLEDVDREIAADRGVRFASKQRNKYFRGVGEWGREDNALIVLNDV